MLLGTKTRVPRRRGKLGRGKKARHSPKVTLALLSHPTTAKNVANFSIRDIVSKAMSALIAMTLPLIRLR